MTRTHTVIFRILLFIALSAITLLAITHQDYALARAISDKGNHILAFYVLAFLVDFSFPETEMGFSKVIALLAYGVLIEFIQSFLPGRTASSLDVAVDAVGMAMYKFSLPLVKQLPLLDVRWRA